MASSPDTGRLVAVTLRDVPEKIRLHAAAIAADGARDACKDPLDGLAAAAKIMTAARLPSANRYWLPAGAVAAVLGNDFVALCEHDA